ncbi:M48 family metallopeptidase [Thalassotalea sp. PLHSN55]|uniref:M48 family metallopeptidase n=1 Tax=Thalassotalea sp. PLHSN55 TaxID=3435888 RepID=UPI003F83EA76
MSLNYQLIRSAKRKTVGLQVKQGAIFVRAPYYVSEQDIAAIVEAKATWLKQKQTEQQNKAPLIQFEHGSRIWIKGVQKSLAIEFASQPSVTESLDSLSIVLEYKYQLASEDTLHQKIAQAFEAWLLTLGKAYIPQRLDELSQITQLFPQRYQIKKYKARWGSCNSKKELSFNYLLMMAPTSVIDYVIIHELCHLQYLNHSSHFWQLVAQFYPNVKAAKNWLKAHQADLTW